MAEILKCQVSRLINYAIEVQEHLKKVGAEMVWRSIGRLMLGSRGSLGQRNNC